MGLVYEYLSAIFLNWWAIVTGILFGLDQLLEWLWPDYRNQVDKRFSASTRRQIFLSTILVIVFISGFLAWQDEHNKVNEKQAEINRQASELTVATSAKQEMDQLRNELAELRKKTSSRHLSKEEEKALINTLSVLGPHGVIIDHEAGNDEAHIFSEELVSMFKAIPGWKVNGSNFTTVLGPRKTGVFIFVTDQGDVPQAAAVVMASFRRQDIAFELKRVEPTPKNYLGPRVFRVFVRNRP